jgi:hypothetical protein
MTAEFAWVTIEVAELAEAEPYLSLPAILRLRRR